MVQFRLSNAAVDDFISIGRYTEQHWGKEQRNLYLERLDHAIHQLAEQSLIGKPCDTIRRGYRKYPEGKHIIFYRIADDGYIEVIRILHQLMEPLIHL